MGAGRGAQAHADHFDFCTGEGAVLLGYVVLQVVVAAANAITFKLMLDKFKASDHDYEFFVNQWSVFLYVVLAALILFYNLVFRKKRYVEERRFAKRKFAFMGFLDGLSGFLSSVGGAYTSGQLQTLMNQSIIPMTIIMSVLFLGVSYRRAQKGGALGIFAGALVAVIPSLTSGNSGGTRWYSAIIFFIGVIPSAFSNVYKESAFKSASLDVYYLTTLVSILQVLLGFLFLPLLALPGMGGVPFKEMGAQITDGFSCFLGNNPRPTDDCDGATVMLLAYVIVNFFYNVLLLLITKHGSALLVVIASALALPVTNILFSQQWLLGDAAEPLSAYDIAGLVVVVAGFVVYSFVGRDNFPAQGAGGTMMYIKADETAPLLRRATDPSPIPIPRMGENQYDELSLERRPILSAPADSYMRTGV